MDLATQSGVGPLTAWLGEAHQLAQLHKEPPTPYAAGGRFFLRALACEDLDVPVLTQGPVTPARSRDN